MLVLEMKQISLLLITVLFIGISSYSQTSTTALSTLTPEQKIKDSLQNIKDSTRWAKLEASAVFPIYKAGKWSGVLPVAGVDEVPDTKKQYNLVFDFTHFNKDTAVAINEGLTEIARIINLHAAAGIPKNHIHPVNDTHAKALFSVFNNEAYRAKYKKDNPNIEIISEMMKDNIKFVACGQAMGFLDVQKQQLYPGFKVAVSAKTTVSYYVQQGYMLYDIDELE